MSVRWRRRREGVKVAAAATDAEAADDEFAFAIEATRANSSLFFERLFFIPELPPLPPYLADPVLEDRLDFFLRGGCNLDSSIK